jgi:putative protease
MVPEILAPAGGRAQFFAALNAGADAVYLGLKAFNARARAENFTENDLRELVPLARERGMKILVTLNVLVKDEELPTLVETMATLEELEVDAIIVQDLGVAKIAREHFPRLRLHASTQMAVHNLAGVKEAVAHGFRRVVLARELTAQEIRRIRAGVPRSEVELEAFCHGSLCYSYSGLCFFSGAEDARSGNRGECAYTCRVPYKILSEPGHGFLFSMRDLDTSDSLAALIEAGVDTLKIEGRKKDAQYVASTVQLYRKRLDELFGRSTGRTEPWETPESDLAYSFQRKPTSFFVKGRYHENVIDLDNPTHVGARVGTVERVRGRSITFVTEAALERFDGLRLVEDARVYHSMPQSGAGLPGDARAMQDRYDGKLAEFSLREMRVGGRKAHAADAGTLVEIELPPEVALPRPGDLVHKTRSADLKRRVDELAQPPADARLRPLRLVETSLEARLEGSPTQLRLTAAITKLGVAIRTASLELPLIQAKGRADLVADAQEVFHIFGDAGFLSSEITIDAADAAGLFVPRSRLKELKALIGEGLASAYDAMIDARRESALVAVCPAPHVVTARRREERRFSVKSDRLETLAEAVRFASENPGFQLDELVFEPKRAFLPALDPAALANKLLELQGTTSARLRLALPTVIRAWDEPLLKRWLQASRAVGLNAFEIGNLGAFDLLRSWSLVDARADVASDFTLYALNSNTATLWAEQGLRKIALSVEDDGENIASHAARLPEALRGKLQAILFKDTPLFIAEACSLTALHDGCPTAKVCGYRTLEIENPKGEVFFVAHESCKSIVYAKDAFSITHRQDALLAAGIADFRVDFLTRAYDAEGVRRVLAAALCGERLDGTHPANFERRLL